MVLTESQKSLVYQIQNQFFGLWLIEKIKIVSKPIYHLCCISFPSYCYNWERSVPEEATSLVKHPIKSDSLQVFRPKKNM